jgi:uncharacterized protein (DUF2267 family)
MIIKYKGYTSDLLTDISLELGNTVDLKTSEIILKTFFQRILKDLSIEKTIEILSSLPTHLKPFCLKSKENQAIEHALFQTSKVEITNKIIFQVLNKHISSERISVIYSCFPENNIPKALPLKKEVPLAA